MMHRSISSFEFAFLHCKKIKKCVSFDKINVTI